MLRPQPFVLIMKTEPFVSPNRFRGYRPKPVVAGLFLLLTSNQWLLACGVGIITALIGWPYYSQISIWVGVALFLVGVTVVHFRYAAQYIIPFPHIAILIAALQYVLAAWVSHSYPNDSPMYNIGARLPKYLPFATLVLLACATGWGLGLAGMRIPLRRATIKATPDLLLSLDALLVFGFLNVPLARITQGTSLAFLFILLACLRYVGVYGRMICRGTGWTWRLAVVLVGEMLYSATGGMFHNLLLWTAWSFALWSYLYRPAWSTILIAIVGGMLLLPPIQAAKLALREEIWDTSKHVIDSDLRSSFKKSSFWLTVVGSQTRQMSAGHLDADLFSETVVRLNQGWIVDRVMEHVPKYEPYARGKTLKNAFISALVPRLFYPHKVITGGLENMEKYAGLTLDDETSMNLGYAGEMYANFGYWGGIIGCSLYCLAFALLFRAVCIRAFVSPLWWSIIPYIGYTALKAEDDIVGVVNWTSKACVVLAAIIFTFPAFRRALFAKSSRSIIHQSSADERQVRI